MVLLEGVLGSLGSLSGDPGFGCSRAYACSDEGFGVPWNRCKTLLKPNYEMTEILRSSENTENSHENP